MNFSRSARKGFNVADGYAQISDRAYTGIIGGMVGWGILLTALLNQVFGSVVLSMNPLTFLILYLVLAIAGSMMTRSKSIAVCVLGYHLVVVPLAACVSIALNGYGYDSSIVTKAVWCTFAITILMTGVATIFPKFFLKIGSALGISLILVIIVEIAATFLFPSVFDVTDYIVVLIFSLYIGFDWARAGVMERTVPNAIYSATQIFVDIINIFIRLLEIFGKNSSKD